MSASPISWPAVEISTLMMREGGKLPDRLTTTSVIVSPAICSAAWIALSTEALAASRSTMTPLRTPRDS